MQWRLALANEISAILVILGSLVGGIYYAATGGYPLVGLLVACAAITVLIAYARANAASARYQRWWLEEEARVRAYKADQIIEEE